jgi:hypothetical protein
MSDYFKKRQGQALGIIPPDAPKKKSVGIKPISDKKAAAMKAEKEARGEQDSIKEKWFKNRRHEMVGTCQCGCAKPSSKYDDKNFRSSAAHIFPQRLFPSVQYHPLNWVERAIWATKDSSSCHTNMDNQSMDIWPNFSDWDDIKEKFYVLAPLLPDEERATKFYKNLECLIYAKQ